MPLSTPARRVSTPCQRLPGECQRPVNAVSTSARKVSTSCQRPVNARPKSVNALSTLCQKAKNVKPAKIRQLHNPLNTNDFTIPPRAPKNHPDSFCPCHTKQNFSPSSQNARCRRDTPSPRILHVRMPGTVSESRGNSGARIKRLFWCFLRSVGGEVAAFRFFYFIGRRLPNGPDPTLAYHFTHLPTPGRPFFHNIL